MHVFQLNDARKRAKTKFEAAKLEYENAKAELRKQKKSILDIFKELDSDEVSSKSEKWNQATIQVNREITKLFEDGWVRYDLGRLIEPFGQLSFNVRLT